MASTPSATRNGVKRTRARPASSTAHAAATTTMPPPSAPARLQPTVTSRRRPNDSRARNADRRCRGERRSEQKRLDLVRDAVEAPAAVRMRADRGERVHVGPGDEDDEEEREKARRRQPAGTPGASRGAARHAPVTTASATTTVSGLSTPTARSRSAAVERDRRDEHRRPPGDRDTREDPERREGDEPADEDERRARARVVRSGQPRVEACERRRQHRRRRGSGSAAPSPAAIAFAVGATSASETSPSILVEPEVSRPR